MIKTMFALLHISKYIQKHGVSHRFLPAISPFTNTVVVITIYDRSRTLPLPICTLSKNHRAGIRADCRQRLS